MLDAPPVLGFVDGMEAAPRDTVWVRWIGLGALLTFFALMLASCFEGDPAPQECGCASPPRCGTSCESECGCCPARGSGCSETGIFLANQSLNCFEFIPCSGPDRCVVGENGPVCAESTNDCEAVRADYESRLQGSTTLTVRSGEEPLAAGIYSSIQCAQGCRVAEGHCTLGLDTCWILAFGPDPELDRLANLYQALGCPSLGPCDCPPAPVASCKPDPRGASGDYPGPLACTVE